ncbi:DUF167 domain-containing protein [bacterium]|nr:DUF167 domain-containing protein [bacterium]
MATKTGAEMPGCCRQVAEGVFRIAVKVKPNAQSSRLIGFDPARQCLDVALNAPPRDGEANDELLRLIRERLGLRRSEVLLFAGHKSRDKIIECHCSWEVLRHLFNE